MAKLLPSSYYVVKKGVLRKLLHEAMTYHLDKRAGTKVIVLASELGVSKKVLYRYHAGGDMKLETILFLLERLYEIHGDLTNAPTWFVGMLHDKQNKPPTE